MPVIVYYSATVALAHHRAGNPVANPEDAAFLKQQVRALLDTPP